MDEAHNATGNSPMSEIMFYFDQSTVQRPKFLGITASPVMRGTSKELEKLESKLSATVITPQVHRHDLLRFANRPTLEAVHYELSPDHLSRTSLALSRARREYDPLEDPWVKYLAKQADCTAGEILDKSPSKVDKSYCRVQLKKLCNHSETICRELGGDVADYFISTCARNLEKAYSDPQRRLSPLGWSHDEDLYLCRLLRDVTFEPGMSQKQSPNLFINFLSPKMETLLHILEARASSSDFMALIFVDQRATAVLCARVLNEHPITKEKLKVGSMVGTSNMAGRQDITELSGLHLQEQTLENFRQGRLNVLVSTNVLEEGIDIPACNTVVCFNEPPNLVSFIQRRGRARQKQAEYLIFVPVSTEDTSVNRARWEEHEDTMVRTYQDEERRRNREIEIEEREVGVSSRVEEIASTNALITFQNAFQRLDHFCNTLRGRHSPQYSIRNVSSDDPPLKKATVRLPLQIAMHLREGHSRESWHTERMAKRDAAFEVFVALYKHGLVNDNLMPLHKREDSVEVAANIPWMDSLIEVLPQWDPYQSFRNNEKLDGYFPRKVHIKLSEGDELDLVVMTPLKWPQATFLELYWTADCVCAVRIGEAEPVDHQIDQYSSALSRTTFCILSLAFPQRLSGFKTDFLNLIIPKDVRMVDASCWVSANDQNLPVTEASMQNKPYKDIGLIRDKLLPGSKWLFQSLTKGRPTIFYHPFTDIGKGENDELSYEELCVEVQKVARRSDFLHKPGRHELGRAPARHLVRAENCAMDTLPARFAKGALLIPSIIHVCEIQAIAHECKATLLRSVPITNVDLILTALCTTQAREKSNYERLEAFGDKALKLCTSIQLIARNPLWHEGLLSQERDRVVSNQRLTRACQVSELERFIITDSFTGLKWRPAYRSDAPPVTFRPRKISSKTLADVVEALVGASVIDVAFDVRLDYRDGMGDHYQVADEGLTNALACLGVFLPSVFSASSLHDLHDCLHENLRSKRHGNLDKLIQNLARQTNHPSPDMLLISLTHSSYNLADVDCSYEIFEFLGDAVLDYMVTLRLYNYNSANLEALSQSQIHIFRAAVVSGDILAFLTMEFLTVENIHNVITSLEDSLPVLAQSRRTVYVCDMIQHHSIELNGLLRRCKRLHLALRSRILSRLFEANDDTSMSDPTCNPAPAANPSTYPHSLLAIPHYPKVVSDVFEAILGSIYVASHPSKENPTPRNRWEACAGFLEKTRLFPLLRQLLEHKIKCDSPKTILGILLPKVYGKGHRTYEDVIRDSEGFHVAIGVEQSLRSTTPKQYVRVKELSKCTIRDLEIEEELLFEDSDSRQSAFELDRFIPAVTLRAYEVAIDALRGLMNTDVIMTDQTDDAPAEGSSASSNGTDYEMDKTGDIADIDGGDGGDGGVPLWG